MKESIKKLKKLVSELESYIYCDNHDMINQLSKEIIDITSQINNKVSSSDERIESQLSKHGLDAVSTVPFLYKPITVKNYYDGDYLERFSNERSENLKKANALEIHDRFWTSNNAERGNIFGSVPLDLIPKDSAKSLMHMGWERNEVTIYEVTDEISLRELDKLCERIFKHYLIVTEMKNKELLVLEYKD